jgi:hypothetical protein
MWKRPLIAGAALALMLTACGDDAGIVEGSPAPAFSLSSAAGETVSLADYGDGPVLLFFHMADG